MLQKEELFIDWKVSLPMADPKPNYVVQWTEVIQRVEYVHANTPQSAIAEAIGDPGPRERHEITFIAVNQWIEPEGS